ATSERPARRAVALREVRDPAPGRLLSAARPTRPAPHRAGLATRVFMYEGYDGMPTTVPREGGPAGERQHHGRGRLAIRPVSRQLDPARLDLTGRNVRLHRPAARGRLRRPARLRGAEPLPARRRPPGLLDRRRHPRL